MGRWTSVLRAVALVTLLTGCGGHDGSDIPHAVASDADDYCRNCHAGRAGAPKSSHNGRDGCASCHEVGTTGLYPAKMPHVGGDEADCALCHATGTAGASRATHLSETGCYSCHQAPSYAPWPPPTPHSASSTADATCNACHGQAHNGERSSCVTCHRL
ncbi:MAG TPA: hypothetical protein PLI95_08185 [Polyangiaceae bacterium]|nr:hypothetical protein [Polyangiaceae bacterium]